MDGILTGKSPLEKNMPLFPAKATHQQLLGLVHRPSNPERPAPAVPRERKWLGDNVGWEGGNRIVYFCDEGGCRTLLKCIKHRRAARSSGESPQVRYWVLLEMLFQEK